MYLRCVSPFVSPFFPFMIRHGAESEERPPEMRRSDPEPHFRYGGWGHGQEWGHVPFLRKRDMSPSGSAAGIFHTGPCAGLERGTCTFGACPPSCSYFTGRRLLPEKLTGGRQAVNRLSWMGTWTSGACPPFNAGALDGSRHGPGGTKTTNAQLSKSARSAPAAQSFSGCSPSILAKTEHRIIRVK